LRNVSRLTYFHQRATLHREFSQGVTKMKIKILIGTVLTLGISSAAFAFNAPERITCGLESGRLNCSELNRNYLVEDVYSANFPKGKSITFNFNSAAAYFSTGMQEATVLFTYRNSASKMVRLKTAESSIKPDLRRGAWRKVNEDLYVCDEGYMSCPIINLPSTK
jgi:hypothetical protein